MSDVFSSTLKFIASKYPDNIGEGTFMKGNME